MPPTNIMQPERFNFTEEMDETILVNIGNRTRGTFSTLAYHNVFVALQSKFPEFIFCKTKIANHIKYLRNKYTGCFDIFRNISKSGFGINPITKTWDIEDDVWNELIKANPSAKTWRDKPIPLYEKLEGLFARDRVTGDHAVTASEIKARRKINDHKQGRLIKYINRQGLVSPKEIEIEGLGEFGIGTSETSQATPILNSVANTTGINISQQGGSSVKGNKRKRKIDTLLESCYETLMNIDKVISAEKQNSHDPSNVLQSLEEIDFDERFKRKAFFHLSRNPVDYEMIIALPLAERCETLWEMLVDIQIISDLEPSPYEIRR